MTKSPKTTLESIFDAKELQTFNMAVITWQGITKNTMTMLQNTASIGNALNLLYDRGQAKGLKKQQIAQMASEHFQGLSEVDRSVYRRLTGQLKGLTVYVRESGIMSDNPRYLLNSYIAALKEDCVECKLIEQEQRNPALILEGTPEGQKTLTPLTLNKPKNVKTPEPPKQSTETTLKSICSDVRKAITADILSAKQMAQIERELTMTLALIHSVQEAENGQEVVNA